MKFQQQQNHNIHRAGHIMRQCAAKSRPKAAAREGGCMRMWMRWLPSQPHADYKMAAIFLCIFFCLQCVCLCTLKMQCVKEKKKRASHCELRTAKCLLRWESHEANSQRTPWAKLLFLILHLCAQYHGKGLRPHPCPPPLHTHTHTQINTHTYSTFGRARQAVRQFVDKQTKRATTW